MKKYKIMCIALLLNDNKAHSYGEVVNEDQLPRDAAELIGEGFISEVVETKTAAQLKAEKKAADDLQAQKDKEAADALQAQKDQEAADALKAQQDKDAADALKAEQDQAAADELAKQNGHTNQRGG